MAESTPLSTLPPLGEIQTRLSEIAREAALLRRLRRLALAVRREQEEQRRRPDPDRPRPAV